MHTLREELVVNHYMALGTRKCCAQKKLFKAKLRQCKYTKETYKADAMTEALNCGNRSDFWKKVRAAGPKKSHSLASNIDNISGTAAIAEMWKNKFSNSLNEQNASDAREIFPAGASDNLQGIGCNVADVKRLLPLLLLNKSP